MSDGSVLDHSFTLWNAAASRRERDCRLVLANEALLFGGLFRVWMLLFALLYLIGRG